MTMSLQDRRTDPELEADDRVTATSGSDDELARAAREAELARQSFSDSVRTASESGVEVVRRVAAGAKPVVVGALVIGGAAVLVAAARLVRRSRSRSWSAPERPTAFGSILRAAATRLLLAGAVRAAQHIIVPRLLRAAGVPPEQDA